MTVENYQKSLADCTVKELLEIAKAKPHFLYDIVGVIGSKYFVAEKMLANELDNNTHLLHELHQLREYIEKLKHNESLFILPDGVEKADPNYFTGLTLDGYQEAASRTANSTEGFNSELTNYAMGIAGESGEVVDLIKKAVCHKHELKTDELAKELGDVLWYIANIARLIGIPLETIAQLNVDKLKKRYPDGFSTAASRNRVE